MVIGAPQSHLAQCGREGLVATTYVASLVSRRTGQVGTGVVRVVGVQPLLDGPHCDRERSSPGCGLYRLEVQPVGRARGDQRFDFADDLGFERRFEPPF